MSCGVYIVIITWNITSRPIKQVQNKTAGIQHLLLNLRTSTATSENCDIWRSAKSLTSSPFSPSLRMDVFNQKPFPLKHALTHRLSKPLCDRRSSGEPRLICLWLQKDLKHTRCPCSALINGSGEMLDEGVKKKSVCVQDFNRDVGVFQQLNYIKRQSPSDMHTHIYSPNKYGCSHSCRLMNVNVFTGTFLPLGGIRWNKTAQCWDGKRFWLEERVSTHTSEMFFWSACLLGRKYYKGLACLFWLVRVKVNGQGWINWDDKPCKAKI